MVKEPVAAETVFADTVVNDPVVPLTVAALIVPVLVMLVYVMPVSVVAKFMTSFMECVCPSIATLLPPTVIEENVPSVLVMAVSVIPESFASIAETDADTVAMFPLRLVREASSPVTYAIVWVCPSNATALPFTVNDDAWRLENVI